MKHIKIILIILIFFAGCARKQRGIFDFPDPNKKPEVKINMLALPCVKKVFAEKTESGNRVFWDEVSYSNNLFSGFNKEDLDIEFVGYNLYRLVNNCFIPKKTVNKRWITKTEYLDDQVLLLESECTINSYLVRVVFRVNGKIIEGPASQIVSIEKLITF